MRIFDGDAPAQVPAEVDLEAVAACCAIERIVDLLSPFDPELRRQILVHVVAGLLQDEE